MPVHDWKRVGAGTFHAFHTAWITHLGEALNGGLLPSGYYAMAEQWAGGFVTDVLTLRAPVPAAPSPPMEEGGVAVRETPPKVGRKLSLAQAARRLRRTLTIRHTSGHQVVALLEVVSPANKDRPAHVEGFVDKLERALENGIHVLLVDLIPPGPYDPQGMHGALWDRFESEPYGLPSEEPLTLASYVAEPQVEAYLEHLAVGSSLVEMPLFLQPERYVNVPLDSTYMASYQGMPGFWRDVLEGRRPPPGSEESGAGSEG